MSLHLTPTMLHGIDEQGRIYEVSDLWLEKLGYTREEVLGRPSTDFLTEESARYARDVVLPAFFVTGSCTVEYGMRCKDGSTLPVRLRGIALRRPDGTFERSLAVIEDLTEQHALEQTMLAAQKLESLGVMAGNIAHDFNNLLASIVGSAQLARRHAREPAALRSLDLLLVAAERGADLCKQLLAYSGHGRFEHVRVDLGVVVTEMADVLAVTVGPGRIELQLGHGNASIEADPTQVRQVVMNLVLNSADALADRNRGTITLRTAVVELDAATIARTLRPEARPGSYVLLEVTDDGIGMSPEAHASMFAPFFSTKGVGRGLGLAAVHGIVRGHHATIAVHSEQGVGTRVQVFWPRATPDQADTGADAALATTEPQSSIAIVDDDDLLRSTLARQLVDAGYRAVAVATGAEAVDLAARGEISAFLIDLVMPEEPGHEVARRILAIAPSVRIVLMSGYSNRELPPAVRNLPVLRKPFSEGELLAALGAQPDPSARRGTLS